MPFPIPTSWPSSGRPPLIGTSFPNPLSQQIGLVWKQPTASDCLWAGTLGNGQNAPIPTHLAPLDIPIISAMTGQPVQPGTKLHDYFSQQLTSQVDFISLINTLSPMCDLMIEVGTGKVLSKLAQANIAPSRDPMVNSTTMLPR